MLTQFKQLFDIRVLWMVLLSGMLTSCKKPEAAAAGAPPAAVTTGSAELRDVPIYLDEIGNVAATESVTLRPQVDGRITSVNFVEDDVCTVVVPFLCEMLNDESVVLIDDTMPVSFAFVSTDVQSFT